MVLGSLCRGRPCCPGRQGKLDARGGGGVAQSIGRLPAAAKAQRESVPVADAAHASPTPCAQTSRRRLDDGPDRGRAGQVHRERLRAAGEQVAIASRGIREQDSETSTARHAPNATARIAGQYEKLAGARSGAEARRTDAQSLCEVGAVSVAEFVVQDCANRLGCEVVLTRSIWEPANAAVLVVFIARWTIDR